MVMNEEEPEDARTIRMTYRERDTSEHDTQFVYLCKYELPAMPKKPRNLRIRLVLLPTSWPRRAKPLSSCYRHPISRIAYPYKFCRSYARNQSRQEVGIGARRGLGRVNLRLQLFIAASLGDVDKRGSDETAFLSL